MCSNWFQLIVNWKLLQSPAISKHSSLILHNFLPTSWFSSSELLAPGAAFKCQSLAGVFFALRRYGCYRWVQRVLIGTPVLLLMPREAIWLRGERRRAAAVPQRWRTPAHPRWLLTWFSVISHNNTAINSALKSELGKCAGRQRGVGNNQPSALKNRGTPEGELQERWEKQRR